MSLNPQIRHYQDLQDENPLSRCKAGIFFHFVDIWDGPLIYLWRHILTKFMMGS